MRKTLLMTSLAVNMILAGNVWAGSCGQGCSWEKNGTKLVITATDGAVMDDFSEHWNADRQVYETTAPWGADVTEVEIIGGLTNISRSAFEGANLTSINIPSSVTSIDKWAFARTPSLMDMIIPSSVTNIGEVVFTGKEGK